MFRYSKPTIYATEVVYIIITKDYKWLQLFSNTLPMKPVEVSLVHIKAA